MSLLKNTTLIKFSQLLLVVVLMGSVSCTRTEVVKVLIHTDLGEIELEVYPELAPITASNFLTLVEQGVYTNAIFYRVVRMDNQPQNRVKIEVIQGGLYDDDLVATYSTIEHENTKSTGIKHTNGVLSMARNEPGTASTEFFICIGDQPSLDFGGDRNPDKQGFAAFGQVAKGMEVVSAIQGLPENGQVLQNRVLIRGMTVIQ